MNITEAKKHVEDIKNELSLLIFHQETLQREIELLKPEIESSVLMPDGRKEIESAKFANKQLIEKRKQFYYASMELAETMAKIEATKELLSSYLAHIRQETERLGQKCTDEMIFDALHQAQSLKNLSESEKAILEEITKILPKKLNASKEERIEIYEMLNNLIIQHGRLEN